MATIANIQTMCRDQELRIQQLEQELTNAYLTLATYKYYIHTNMPDTIIGNPTIQPPEGIDLVDDNFNFSGKRVLLTYMNHLDKVDYSNWLVAKMHKAGNSVKFLGIAHKRQGVTYNYDHSHVVVELKKTHHTNSPDFFDYKRLHPHVRILKSSKCLKKAKSFLDNERQKVL